MKNFSSADLHIHSKYSNRAADWLLRKLDFPASTTEPRRIYDTLKKKGMDFVTITDHNTIAGGLEIANEPDTFLSEELTASFPEDGCKVHLLVWGITPDQHEAMQVLRSDIYQLRDYLSEEKIAHGVAHPLHSPDEKLTPGHVQRLILLFKNFEGINGRYNELLSDCVRFMLSHLDAAKVRGFAEKWARISPLECPWEKGLFGGSDDQGGVLMGRAYTRTPWAKSVHEFLAYLRDGHCEAYGRGGLPSTLAHGTYSTAFAFVKQRLAINPQDPAINLVEKMFSRFMEGRDPTEFSLGEKVSFLVQGIATGKIFEFAKVGQSSLWKELAAYFAQPSVKEELARITAGAEEPERRAFFMADLVANQLAFRFLSQFLTQISGGKLLESIQMIMPVVPILILLAPYFHAFRMTSRRRLKEICQGVCGEMPPALKADKRAWFTDTLDDVNGVTTTIRKMTAEAVSAERDLTIVVSKSEPSEDDIPVVNFPPVGEFALPEYELQRLSFPPVLRILDYISTNHFSELIISTPGPVGLTALLAAKLLGLRSVSIYHTDFPQYVGILTDDSFMETLTWNYMRWFYAQQEMVFVNSEDYRKCLCERGITTDRLHILPRGLDTRLFHPARRDTNFWKARGLEDGKVGVLYVGRISKEKNLDILVAASREIERQKIPARLLFVGNGPYMNEMQQLLPDAIFTGYLAGEELAKAYASADIFAFPSTTDTFGNVIIEAQACGLPCIVTDMGGPRDLVDDGNDGLIVRALDVGQLARAIADLANNPAKRQAFSKNARKKVESRDWAKAFEEFWGMSN